MVGGAYAEAAARAAPMRHELMVVDPAAHEGDRPPCCDAVDLLWFDDADRALDALTGVLAVEAGWVLAGVAFGAEPALVRPLRVV
ncbi:MAG: hypothetical protein JWN32_1214 [Solirubrobacterales bacterium]|nr:hypothetical protein [Solirubrobacterales bacterium]